MAGAVGAVPSRSWWPPWSTEGCVELHDVSRKVCTSTDARVHDVDGVRLDSCKDACNRMGSDCWAIKWVDGEGWCTICTGSSESYNTKKNIEEWSQTSGDANVVSKACWTPTGDDDENLFPGTWSDGYDDFSPFNVDLHDDDNFTRVNDDVMPESLVIGYVMTDDIIYDAVVNWCTHRPEAAIYGDIATWNTSELTDMTGLFSASKQNGFGAERPIGFMDSCNPPIGDWDVSSVTSMRDLFLGATAFNQPIGDWDVSKVTSFRNTFNMAWAFNQDLSSWDVSSATTLDFTFAYTESFNQKLDWDVRRVTSFWSTFKHASAFEQELCWDLSNAVNTADMFWGSHGTVACGPMPLPTDTGSTGGSGGRGEGSTLVTTAVAVAAVVAAVALGVTLRNIRSKVWNRRAGGWDRGKRKGVEQEAYGVQQTDGQLTHSLLEMHQANGRQASPAQEQRDGDARYGGDKVGFEELTRPQGVEGNGDGGDGGGSGAVGGGGDGWRWTAAHA
mmetsp:Transcript_11073/g.29674  ORF Transcript_11073/g.29674 Transcript_11073/m.29674 type:complete len:502 (+) Transcript_11073:166-1671(+)